MQTQKQMDAEEEKANPVAISVYPPQIIYLNQKLSGVKTEYKQTVRVKEDLV